MAFVLGVAATLNRSDTKRVANNVWFVAIQLVIYWFILTHSQYHFFLRTVYNTNNNQIKSLLATEKYPILADDYLGLLVQSGMPIYFEPCAMTQLWYAGRWSQEPLLRELHDGRFSLILMTSTPSTKAQRWTPEMLQTISERYRLEQKIGSTEVWRPRLQIANEPANSMK